ncbi:MAG: hypothetical protein IT168_14250 [Bryobacterales bacterium]|nr:hypothetical protein [Bryobacterales bacterium]
MRLAVLSLLLAGILRADLDTARSEPNLEKRSEKAMLNAEAALDSARKAYETGDMKAVRGALTEIGDSIALTRESLDSSGKNARKSPKYFKKAELALRKLMRRLDSFRLELGVDERPPVETLLQSAHSAHDHILAAIMGTKK